MFPKKSSLWRAQGLGGLSSRRGTALESQRSRSWAGAEGIDGPCGKESLVLLKADRMNFSLCPWQFFTAQLFHLGVGSQWKEARIASLTSHNIQPVH